MLGSSFWSVLPAPPHGCVRESLSRFLCDEAHRFNSDRAGNVGMIFAAMLVPVTSIIGMSVDFGRAMKMRTDLQTALDAAVLAGGREYQTSGDEDRAIARAETYLSRSFDDVAYTFVRKHVDPDESAIEMVVRAEVETTFLRILGEQAIDISAGSRADLSGAGRDMDLEIALMLDVTGSMGGQKIADLRDAASDLVEIILNGDRNGHTSRVAVVPFSEGVRPGDAYIAEVRGTPAGSFRFRDRKGRQQTYSLSKCVTERTGAEAYTDAAPGPGTYVGANYTSNGSCIPSNTILPLSANRSAILNKISLLTANGYTAGQLGTAWAWYTLSPEWADIWPAASRPAAYDPGTTMKVAVLMTDGEYNTQFKDGVDTRNISGSSPNGSSDAQARQLCAAMKAAGIRVFTVGFQLTDSNAVATLQGCASSGSDAFLASDGDELRQAFRNIALQLADLRLTR